MTSRETKEKCIPSCPMAMPSDTDTGEPWRASMSTVPALTTVGLAALESTVAATCGVAVASPVLVLHAGVPDKKGNLKVLGIDALLVLRDRDRLRSGSAGWRTYAAMALGGIALTIKQMTFCEVAFLGLYAAWLLKPTDLRRVTQVLSWIALGVLPTAAIALTYYALGHWAEYWQAMVTANVTKGALPVGGMGAISVPSSCSIR